MDSRLPHIDVFKGILIIMVVIGHVVFNISMTTGAELSAMPYIVTSYVANKWMAPYYMVAFFMVTGYCSSFKDSLFQQIVKDGKRLLIPAVIIPRIMAVFTPPI